MLLAIDFEPSSFLAVLLVGVVTATLMVRLHITRRKQKLNEISSRLGGERVRVACAPPEVLRWQTEIHEFTRDVQGRLDNKIAMLQQLLAAADERIARLDALETRRLQNGRQTPQDETRDDTARYAAVFAMADAGHGPVAIAGRIGVALGEVEMILSLRRSPAERRSA